jgi:predicted dehydrogenase
MKKLRIAAMGIEHRHIFGQLKGMLDLGCECKGWWTENENKISQDFKKKYSTITRVFNKSILLEDPEIDLILIADIPVKRGPLAVECMNAGKDVMLDKPGCTNFEQLEEIKKTIDKTKRIFSIDFSERFEVPSVELASKLVKAGEIGDVVQTIGLGPHRLNIDTRPKWFFKNDQYGGILCDIASHQIDQFLFFTGSTSVEIVRSSVGNFANPSQSEFEDFGEILIHGDKGQGYIRVDWYTPDALPNWGDGRLIILGTEGYVELRKYVDVAGRDGIDHLFLVNKKKCEYIDASKEPLTYFGNLMNDVLNRTETAMKQSHCLKVMKLAIEAQTSAKRLGNLR